MTKRKTTSSQVKPKRVRRAGKKDFPQNIYVNVELSADGSHTPYYIAHDDPRDAVEFQDPDDGIGVFAVYELKKVGRAKVVTKVHYLEPK